jgi:hypothetical protein
LPITDFGDALKWRTTPNHTLSASRAWVQLKVVCPITLKPGMGFRAKDGKDAKTETSEQNPRKINITTRVKGSFCINSSLGVLSVLGATLKCRF